MVLKQNTYDIGDAVVPTTANTAGSGDAVGLNPPTGTPTAICLIAAGVDVGAWQGVTNEGCRFTGVTGDVLQHQYTQPASAQFQAGWAFRVDNANPVNTSAWCIGRIRSSAGNAMKLMLSTTGVVQLQNSKGAGIKNFNSNTPLANGYYYADIQGTRDTATTGQLAVQIYNMSTGAQITNDGSYSSSSVDLGVTDVTMAQWGKTESAAGGSVDIKYPRFNTGVSSALGMPTPPATSFTLLKTQNFEGGNVGDPVSTAVPSGANGQSTFDLVQTNGQINRLNNVTAISPRLSLEMQQLAGSTSQINNYLNLLALYTDIGITFNVRFNRLTAGQFTLFRGYGDTTYTATAFNLAFTTAGRFLLQENGQTGATSAGAITPNFWYACQIRYRPGSNQFSFTLYNRGVNTIVAQVNQTLVNALSLGSVRLGVGSTIDTGQTLVTIDDLQIAANGLPPRTDTGNAPPVVNSFAASKTSVDAGGTLTFTADAQDPEGSVADAIWTISCDNGVTPPTMNVINSFQMQVYARAALVDHNMSVTYTPIDDLGLAGETSSVVVPVRRATEIRCVSVGPIVVSPLVVYEAL